jgi:5-methylcytosine-specific restriction endonuclease McrA
MKFCPTCKLSKDISCFSKNSKRKDLLDWQCKLCFKNKYILNKNKINLKNQEYYTNNKKSVLEKQKVWRSKNLQSILLRNRARRIKLSKYLRISQKEINNLIARYNYCCYYCRKNLVKMHMDHYIPLSKGGDHIIENIVPSCNKCNLSKGSKLISEWKK